MTAFADHGAGGNGEPLAIVLRAGSAGSNTAADHIEATRLALTQLPRHLRRKVLVRTDSGGGTHGFLTWLTAPSRRLHYSVGMTVTEDMQAAVLKVPAGSWTPAYDGDGQVRDGAWVADIAGMLDLPPGRPGCGSSSARNGGDAMSFADPVSGEAIDAWLFVAAFSFSAYVYVEAFTDMRLPAWIDAHVHTFEAFGGAGRLLVPDNLRTGVSRSDRYEPALIRRTRAWPGITAPRSCRRGSGGPATSRSWRAVSGSSPTRSPLCYATGTSSGWPS